MVLNKLLELPMKDLFVDSDFNMNNVEITLLLKEKKKTCSLFKFMLMKLF